MSISYEAIRLKFRNKIYFPTTRNYRKKKINSTDFTIISNNCWGGTVYESYGIKKMSPIVGMFIMPSDYLSLVSNLKYYFEQDIVFIEPEQSKWRKQLEGKSNWGTYLIARLGDIELHMLHHHDKELAKSKWDTRVKRINWSKLIFKFNDQNGATKDDIVQFMNLPLKNKLCFVVKDELNVEGTILIKQPGKKETGIYASREPFGRNRYLNVNNYINGCL